MRLFTTAMLIVGALLVGGEAAAQVPTAIPAPPPPPPAGGTPDAIPYGIPYGPPIGVDRAAQVVGVVLSAARQHPAWRFAITVVDPNGDLIYFYRMDGAQLGSIGVSQNKARTAARFRRETRTFYNQFETGHMYVSTLDPTLVASPGGFPLIDHGIIIGGLGCSGGTGDQDATVCKAGADSIQ
jgi:uncharacterized protein GlcG (DUF336 family)